MVHGDDFVSLGTAENIKWFHEQMQDAYEVKIRGVLGPEHGDDKRIEILNRIVEWKSDGIHYEGDPRHADAIIQGMGIKGGRAASTPGTKARERDDDSDVELGRTEAREFRSLAARANFMATDRADIQYSVKEICRRMAKPCKGDWEGLKHLARYLIGKRRLITKFIYQAMPTDIKVFTDTNHAGCLRTRKSTNGGMLMHGNHLI